MQLFFLNFCPAFCDIKNLLIKTITSGLSIKQILEEELRTIFLPRQRMPHIWLTSIEDRKPPSWNAPLMLEISKICLALKTFVVMKEKNR